ncbi:MAG TPA: DNA topoisomerase IB, partial [Polyangiaceae bacterium]
MRTSSVPRGLCWSCDDEPGIRRVGSPGRFRYVGPQGKVVHDRATLQRIRSLVLPPAWTDVWIARSPRGHIQATGRDARGRKQYRYHAQWREHRDADKYERMLAFGRALGRIDRQVEADLRLPGLSRDKVLAVVVRLLELTHARVGNDKYTRSNGSFGLTTLRGRHVRVRGDRVTFHYRGKSGKQRVFDVRDERLARIVRRCDDLPGQHLFEYVDGEGRVHRIGSHDVNAYIRRHSGGEFSAKDFRTLAGTVLAARALRQRPPCESKAEVVRVVKEVVGEVSKRLGNT